jgi:hypothetical protein
MSCIHFSYNTSLISYMYRWRYLPLTYSIQTCDQAPNTITPRPITLKVIPEAIFCGFMLLDNDSLALRLS